jgi:mono/diheme cytochrome c family protein
MRFVRMVVGIVVLAAAIGFGFVYGGGADVAADRPHDAFVGWLIRTARERAVTMRARDIDVPKDIGAAAMIEKGAGEYAEMCAGCHLGPGVADNEFRSGLNPPAPDLASPAATTRDPAQQFWIVKHGIKMSAMPAWGPSHDDATLWSIVAFLQQLPTLTQARYAELTQKAAAEHGAHHHEHTGAASESRAAASEPGAPDAAESTDGPGAASHDE